MSDAYDPVLEAGLDSFPASDPPSWGPISGVGAQQSRSTGPAFTSDLQHVFREVDLSRLSLIGQGHVVLLEAEAFLGRALRDWAEMPDEGAGPHVAWRLGVLRVELSEHRAHIEAEGSLSDSVKTADPWLISQLDHLLSHHAALDGAIARARSEYEGGPAGRRASARIHRRTRGIAAGLTTLLSVERSLLMDQFCEPPALD